MPTLKTTSQTVNYLRCIFISFKYLFSFNYTVYHFSLAFVSEPHVAQVALSSNGNTIITKRFGAFKTY